MIQIYRMTCWRVATMSEWMRRIILALGVVFITKDVLAQGQASRPIVLQLQWRPQAQFAGYMVAKEKGFYREAGLPEVRLQWYVEGDSPLELVLKVKADFCTAWVSRGIVVRAGGGQVVNIAQLMQKSTLMLVTRRAAHIDKPQDLHGRRVSLWGADFDVQPLALFKKFGIQPQIVPQSYSMTPFLRGAVDAASAMYYNEYHKLIEAGMRREDIRGFFYSDYGMNFPEDGIYCTEKTRRERPEVCRAMVSASIRGWAFALSHETEALDIVMKYCHEAQLATNRNHQRWMLRVIGESIRYRVGPSPSIWGTLSREEYENVANALYEQGLIKTTPPYEEFYQPLLAAKETRP